MMRNGPDASHYGISPAGSAVDPAGVINNTVAAMIITAGIGYSGSTRLRWAADARYIDYQNTKGFAKTGFNTQTGAVEGVGWQSIWVLATGVQFQFSDRFLFRTGYGFNENPIRDSDTFFNLGSPLITQHQANIGFSYRLKEGLATSLAYHHEERRSSIAGNSLSSGGSHGFSR